MNFSSPSTDNASSAPRWSSASSVGSGTGYSSDGGSHHGHHPGGEEPLAPPVLVYHESARSIVFRDHLRRATAAQEKQQHRFDQEQGSFYDTTGPLIESSTSSSSPNELGEDPVVSHVLHNHQQDHQVMSTGDLFTLTKSASSDDQYRRSSQAPPPRSHHRSASQPPPQFDIVEDVTNLFTFPESLRVNDDSVQISGFQRNVVPLQKLELGPNDEFAPLLEEDTPTDKWTIAEQQVFDLLQSQHAVVKTLKNSDWTDFLHRFRTPKPPRSTNYENAHDDIGPSTDDHMEFNSFVTSTTLLPPGGKKMRCYGAPSLYTTGVVFALPHFEKEEDEAKAVDETKTWSWPAGYSAKTEFNIDSYGNLINGRQEALVGLSGLRELNNDYVTKQEYMVGGRVIPGGLHTVPYNEVFVRVGGIGRHEDKAHNVKRSLQTGVGLPVALFVRTATFGHLISLLRTRARLMHVLGERHIKGIPLILINPDIGVRVLTEALQKQLLQIAAKQLNPFQNPMLAHKTTVNDTSESHLETKLEELLDLDESIRTTLTPEECARIAGGFGATDDSIAKILKDAMIQDKQSRLDGNKATDTNKLQDIVNEGLAAAVRSGDYYTSRQLLILYSLIAGEGHKMDLEQEQMKAINDMSGDENGKNKKLLIETMPLKSTKCLLKKSSSGAALSEMKEDLPPPPPPPPLDTDRLRSATNSDGLLSVLGAAQVLKAMRDGGARKRTEECVVAVEEWVEHAEQSAAFRIASWRDQRAAQADLKIAFDHDSSFMAFVSNKAITNRNLFAKQLRDAVQQTDFTDVRFLRALYEMANRMHSPCLRLELLQYILGLDNRYSVAHVKRSIELAATCLSITFTVAA